MPLGRNLTRARIPPRAPAAAPAAQPAAPAVMCAPEPPKPPKTVQAKGYRCLFCGAIFEQRPDVCSVCHAIGSFEPVTYQKQV